jgi:hypothetical protein
MGVRTAAVAWSQVGMRGRRLEDRICGLCGHALVAQEPELGAILAELKSALHEHTERLRRKSLERLVGGEPRERRRVVPFS